MIIGTGIDLVDIRRIETLMKKHETRFLARYFTKAEVAHIEDIKLSENKILSIAKRFAAKEACAKALGTGFRDGIYMNNIEIKNDALGKPIISVSNGALEHLNVMLPEGKAASLHLSMTDEPPYAQAQVIIEAI